MRPAERQGHRPVRPIPGQALEPGITVDLQHAREPGEMPRRALGLAVLGVDVGRHGVARSLPGTIIHRITPELPGLGPPAAGLEDGQRGVVGEHLRRRQHRAEQEFVERLQPPAGPSHPVRQGRAIQGHSLAAQYLCLTIERQRVGKLADHDVGDQCLGRHAAIDRPVGRRGDHDGLLASPADIARPPGHPNPQLRRHDVELPGGDLADWHERPAAARAIAVLDVDHHLVARQVRRQGAVVAGRRLRAGLACGASDCVLPSLVGRDGLLEVLEPELELVRAQLLRPASKLVAHEPLHQQPQLLILGVQFAMLEQQRAHDLLQRSGVVRQGLGIDRHGMTLNDRSASLLAENAPVQPASSGRDRATGARHSQPSSRAASCAADSAIRPVDVADSQAN